MDITIVSVLVLIIIALCEGLKVVGVPKRFIPLTAVALGLVGAGILGGSNWIAVVYGVLTGLSASGLYDLAKKTVLNK